MQIYGMQLVSGLGLAIASVVRAARGKARFAAMLAIGAVVLLMGSTTAFAQIAFNTSSLSFGDQTVGYDTAEQVFTVSDGGSSFTYTGVSISSGDFSIDWTPTGHCVAAGGTTSSCTVTVKFHPLSNSMYTSTVKMTYGTSSSVTATVTGTGLPYSANYYYVSPNGASSYNGHTATGNLYAPNGPPNTATDGPLLTLNEARTKVQSSSGGPAGKHVKFESGTYYVGRPLDAAHYIATEGGLATSPTPIVTVCSLFGSSSNLVCPQIFIYADSGSAGNPVIYEAADGATPILSGGVRIPASAWTQLSGSVYYADLSLSHFNQQTPVDFASIFVDTGDGTTGVSGATRRSRPRFGITGNGATGNGDDPALPSGWLRVMEPVAYDNQVYTGGGSCGVGDNSNAECLAYGVCPGPTGTPDANIAIRNYLPANTSHRTYYCNDRFAYYITSSGNDLPSTTLTNFASGSSGRTSAQGQSIELSIDEQFAMSKMRLSSIYSGTVGAPYTWTDAANHVVPVAVMNGPLPITAFGAQFRTGDKYVLDGVEPASANWAGLQGGQWFVDETVTPWRLYYSVLSGESLTGSNPVTVIVPQAAQLIVSSNTTAGQDSTGGTPTYLGASNITFSGLTFAYDNWTVPPTGYQGSQQEPLLTSAISFVNPSYVTFSGVTVAHVGDFGIEFLNDNTATSYSGSFTTGTTYNCSAPVSRGMPECNTVQDSLLYDLGGGGIRVGSFPTSAERDYSEIMASTISDNLIQGYGRNVAGAFGITVGPSHDDTFINNEITDGYDSGISICLPQGPYTACRLFDTSSGLPVSYANGAYNDVVENNLIHNLGQGTLSDLAGVYFAPIESNNTNGNSSGGAGTLTNGDVIQWNQIYDVTQPTEDDGYTNYVYTYLGGMTSTPVVNPVGYGGNGVYTDQQSQSVTITQNLIYRVTGAGWNITYGPSYYPWVTSPLEFTNNIVAFFGSEAVDLSQQEGSNSSSEISSGIWPKHLDFQKNIVFFDKGYDNPSTSRYASVQGGVGWSCGENSSSDACTSSNSSSYFGFDNNAYYDADTNTGDAGSFGNSQAFLTDSPAYTGFPATYQAVVPTTRSYSGATGSWQGTGTGQLNEDPHSIVLTSTDAAANNVFTNPYCSNIGVDNFSLNPSYILQGKTQTLAATITFSDFLSSQHIGRTNTSLNPPGPVAQGWPVFLPGGTANPLPSTSGTAYPTGYCSWF